MSDALAKRSVANGERPTPPRPDAQRQSGSLLQFSLQMAAFSAVAKLTQSR
jgi:hypothetical protein